VNHLDSEASGKGIRRKANPPDEKETKRHRGGERATTVIERYRLVAFSATGEVGEGIF
jgi:hypothetical protein